MCFSVYSLCVHTYHEDYVNSCSGFTGFWRSILKSIDCGRVADDSPHILANLHHQERWMHAVFVACVGFELGELGHWRFTGTIK